MHQQLVELVERLAFHERSVTAHAGPTENCALHVPLASSVRIMTTTTSPRFAILRRMGPLVPVAYKGYQGHSWCIRFQNLLTRVMSFAAHIAVVVPVAVIFRRSPLTPSAKTLDRVLNWLKVSQFLLRRIRQTHQLFRQRALRHARAHQHPHLRQRRVDLIRLSRLSLGN